MSDNKLLAPLKKRYTKDQIVAAIYNQCGARTYICKELDCTLKQFNKFLDDHQDVKLELIKAREQLVDMAQKALTDSLKSENEQVRLRAAELTLRAYGAEFGAHLSERQAMQVSVDHERKTVDIRTIFGIND